MTSRPKVGPIPDQPAHVSRRAAPRRRPPSRANGLDLERIAAAGLAVADSQPPDGLTIRAVADELGVSPMALYHHVENKAALVALIVDAAMREFDLPAPTGLGWREDLWELAKLTRTSMRAHPTVSVLRFQYKVWTPSVLALGEHWMGVWRQSGLGLEEVVSAATASSLAIVGMVHQEMQLKDFAVPARETMSWLPGLRTVFEARFDGDALFELLARSTVDGLFTSLA